MALLAAYSFDEASGAFLDASGNGRNWTANLNAARTATGHTNGGLTKTGTGLPVVASPSFVGTSAWTFMFWQLGLGDAVWWLRLYNNAAGTGSGILLLGGTLRLRLRKTSNTEATITPPAGGGWHHYAATYDGSVGRLYVDGTLSATTATVAAPLAAVDVIDMAEWTQNNTFLDDLRFYDTALDQATIATLRDTPVTAGPSTTPVGATAASSWQARQTAGLAAAGAWPTRSLARVDRAASWPTRSLATASTASSWRARALADRAGATAWATRGLATGDTAAAWQTRATTGRLDGATWQTRTLAGVDGDAAWMTTTLAGSTPAAAWSTRTLAAGDGDTAWATRAVTGRGTAVSWATKTLAGRAAAVAWRARQLAARTAAAAWQIATGQPAPATPYTATIDAHAYSAIVDTVAYTAVLDGQDASVDTATGG